MAAIKHFPRMRRMEHEMRSSSRMGDMGDGGGRSSSGSRMGDRMEDRSSSRMDDRSSSRMDDRRDGNL